jgi:hypothetical protein
MVDLALGDDFGHHDHGNNDKDSKTDLTSGYHETDVADTIATTRRGDMTDEILYLTLTDRKDIIHNPYTDLEGIGQD